MFKVSTSEEARALLTSLDLVVEQTKPTTKLACPFAPTKTLRTNRLLPPPEKTKRITHLSQNFANEYSNKGQ